MCVATFIIINAYKFLQEKVVVVCPVILPVVTIEFETASVTVNESDGSVTVNLVRRTGTLSDNITVCINITMIVDPAIIQRTYVYNNVQIICIRSTTTHMPQYHHLQLWHLQLNRAKRYMGISPVTVLLSLFTV